jgi:hypothetical protein
MKEAFDVMAEHWCVTLWLGLVVMVSLHRTKVTKIYKYKEHKP